MGEDIKSEGLACLERIPQIGEVREIKKLIEEKAPLLVKGMNLKSNLQMLTAGTKNEEKEGDEQTLVLSDNAILESPSEELKDQI